MRYVYVFGQKVGQKTLFGQKVVCLNMDLLLSYLNLQTRGKGMPLNTRLGMWSNYNLTTSRLYIVE